MRVAVIGATGLIGRATADELERRGHGLRRISRGGDHRVDLRTGDGLAEALDGVEVLVNASNGPASGRAAPVLVAGTDRILAVTRAHHVCVSIVGVDALAPFSAYYRVKLEQEAHLRRAGVPFTILRAAQTHEYLGHPLMTARRLGIRLRSPALLQPVAAAAVASAIADAAEADPAGATVNVTGPQTPAAMLGGWRSTSRSIA